MAVSTVKVTKDQNVSDKEECLNKKIPKPQPIIVTPKSNAVCVDLNHQDMHKEYPAPLQHAAEADCHTDGGPSYLKLLTNELLWSRIVVFLITIFLFLLSLCYTFGQILSVEMSKFWCPSVSLSEVRAHSIAIKSNGGVASSCWSTKLNTVKKNLF